MLPDPKKVAKKIDNLFKSKEEKLAERELNRDAQLKVSKSRIRKHISNQRDMVRKLTVLAKRALSLNDEGRFRQVGKQLIWARNDILRWEKYLLSLEMFEARREQAKASTEMLNAVKTVSESLSDVIPAQDNVEMARELQKGLEKASSLDERMEMMMEVMDATMEAGMSSDPTSLDGLRETLTDDIVREEAAQFDQEIEDQLRSIREELEK